MFLNHLTCRRCGGVASVKQKEGQWISLKCKCELVLFQFNGDVVSKPVGEYKNVIQR